MQDAPIKIVGEAPFVAPKNRSQRRAEARESKRNLVRQVINGKAVFHRKK